MGRNVEGLKEALKNVSGKTVSGNTKGEVFDNFNIQYIDVSLTVAVKDSEGEVIAAPTIVLKKGAVVGSGNTITAEADGAYKVVMGSYNYNISKTGYDTEAGVITIDSHDAAKAEAAETVVLKAPAGVTFEVVDASKEVITEPTIVLKKGAVVGSGDTVTAEADGAYNCLTGDYNYSVSKGGYVTATGVFEIVKAQLETMVVKAITLEIDA